MDQEELQDVIMELNSISELLYQENVQPAYGKIVTVLPRLEFLIGQVGEEETKGKLADKLRIALEAMESEDSILLADAIQYEVIESLQQL